MFLALRSTWRTPGDEAGDKCLDVLLGSCSFRYRLGATEATEAVNQGDPVSAVIITLLVVRSPYVNMDDVSHVLGLAKLPLTRGLPQARPWTQGSYIQIACAVSIHFTMSWSRSRLRSLRCPIHPLVPDRGFRGNRVSN